MNLGGCIGREWHHTVPSPEIWTQEPKSQQQEWSAPLSQCFVFQTSTLDKNEILKCFIDNGYGTEGT